jgi:ABC-type multidrug transport system ATPase subunit
VTVADAPAVAQVDALFYSHPQRPLFVQWSARFPAGVTLMQGDEGSGKTTLLRLLAGALPADAGVFEIAGMRLDADPALYRRQVFRTEPHTELPQQLSALEWLDKVADRHPGMDRPALPALIGRLGLREHQDKPLYMLSTGSRRKVWLLAAFACGTPLTLLDQPFDALDKASIVAVRDLLRDVGAQPGRAWVVADYVAPTGVALVQTITLD